MRNAVDDAAFGQMTRTLYTIAQIMDVGERLAALVPVAWTERHMPMTRRLLPRDQRWRLAK